MTEDEKIFDVAPDEKYVDNRSRFTIFFQVFGRKFWKLIGMNLLFIVFNIPSIIISYFLSAFVTDMFMPFIANQEDMAIIMMIYGFPFMIFLMVIPAVTVGPAQAGMTYLLRCFSYEQPTFYWSDFIEKMKENLKQGIAVCLINLAITAVMFVDFYLYDQLTAGGANFMFQLANGLLIIAFILFLMMNMYIYPMMVTYELKLRDLYKNAFLFSMGKFLPNLLVLLICFILVMAPMLVVILTGNGTVLFIVYIYYLLLGFALPGLVLNFFINPVIDRYLRPAPAQQADQ